MDKVKVLVVDDSETEFFIIQDLFKDAPVDTYEFSWSKSKSDAMAEINKDAFDIYFVDYKLGQESGLDLVEEAKSSGCGAPFILLTGFGAESVDDKALKVGVDEYLNKKEINYYVLERAMRYSLERKKVEKVFLKQQEKLLSSIKMSLLGELVSGVAHEINNPIALLTIILTNLKKRISKGESTQDQIFELIEKAQDAIKRMNKITNSLSKYSRDTTTDAFVKTNILDIIEESVSICFGKMRTNKIKIDIKPSDEPLYTNCRPVEIIQVLVNLLNNAVDTISRLDEKWIEISLKNQGGFINIIFKDSSEPASKEMQEKIYTPFFITEKSEGGTGLGLSISRSIIESHGGKINFLRGKENKSLIEISLPQKMTNSSIRSQTVLIVDDKKEMRSLFAKILAEYNINALEADNLNEAFKIFENQSEINVLVIDVDSINIDERKIIQIMNDFEKLHSVALVGSTEKLGFNNSLLKHSKLQIFEKPFDTQKLIEFCT